MPLQSSPHAREGSHGQRQAPTAQWICRCDFLSEIIFTILIWLWIWDHTLYFLGDQGTLVGFYWIAESDRIRYLHKCQELIFILHWHLQKVTKETSSDQSSSILTACENHPGGCNITDAWSLPRPVKSGPQGGASAWTLWFLLVCLLSSQVFLRCSRVWKSLCWSLQFNQHGAVLVCWFHG